MRNRFHSWSKALLRRFAQSEIGTVTAEFVVVFPALVWAWLAMYDYWDVYRAMNQVQKASFTLSDNLSRSAGTVDGAYIDGLLKFMDFMVDGNHPAQLRVTSIQWQAATSKYVVVWSYSPQSKLPELTTADLVTRKSHLPALADLETLILVETRVPYAPPITVGTLMTVDVGLGNQVFGEFIPTRPRYISKVCFTGRACT